MRRARIPTARVFCILLALAGCNGILGIEEAQRRASHSGSIDGSTDSPFDGSDPDGSTLDGSADALADTNANLDSGFDGFIPDFDAGSFDCGVTSLGPVSSAATGKFGPALAFRDPFWSVVWIDESAGGPSQRVVRYNATDDGGSRLFPTDQGITSAADYATHPRLASFQDGFVLAVGVLQGGNAFSAIESLNPDASHGLLDEAIAHTTATVPPEVGGVAVKSTTASFVVASRNFQSGTDLGTAEFNSAFVRTTLAVAAPLTRASGIAWNPIASRLAVAYVTDSAAGRVALTNPPQAVGFTAGLDQPATAAGPTPGVAIVAANNRFAIAWVDARVNPTATEIWLTMIDATTGMRVGDAVQVSASSNTTKLYPRLAFDGVTIGVSWTEQVLTSQYRVMFRRYSQNLVHLEAVPLVASLGKTTFQNGSGLAVGPNSTYGVAFADDTYKQQLVLATCNGP